MSVGPEKARDATKGSAARGQSTSAALRANRTVFLFHVVEPVDDGFFATPAHAGAEPQRLVAYAMILMPEVGVRHEILGCYF